MMPFYLLPLLLIPLSLLLNQWFTFRYIHFSYMAVFALLSIVFYRMSDSMLEGDDFIIGLLGVYFTLLAVLQWALLPVVLLIERVLW